MGISQAFARVHGDASKLKTQLGEIKLLVAGGAVIAGAGFMGLGLLSKTLPDAKEYAHQLAQMNISGMKQAEIAQSISAAWALNKTVPTSTSAQNLLAIREGRTVFGNTQEAINFLPVAQRLAYILENTKGGDVKGETQALARALDLRNATTTAAAAQLQADMMVKAIVASGGVLTAKDFNQTFKYGRTATLGWSNEFAYTILPSLMQELKTGGGSGAGGGPGNPLMSAYAAVVQGTVPQKSLGVWNSLGLLDPSKVVWNKVGTAKGLRPGGIVGSEQFIENPYFWVRDILRPALVRAGYETEKEQRQIVGYLFPNRTAGAVMSTMLFQNRAIERDRGMIGQAQGLKAYESLMKNDPLAADAMLAAQWKNLMAVIGFEILPVLVPLLKKATDGLQAITRWARDNPGPLKVMVLGFGALSAAMAFGGTVILLAAAFKAVGFTLGVLGIGKLFTLAGGIGALGKSSLLFPTIGELMLGFAGTLVRVAGIVGAVAGLYFVGKDAVNSLAGAGRMIGVMASGKSKEEKDVAALEAMRGTRYFNPTLLARAQTKLDAKRNADGSAAFRGAGSPYIAPRPKPGASGGPGTVFLDGRKVGEIIGDRMGMALGPAYAAGRHDPTATQAAPGAPYAR